MHRLLLDPPMQRTVERVETLLKKSQGGDPKRLAYLAGFDLGDDGKVTPRDFLASEERPPRSQQPDIRYSYTMSPSGGLVLTPSMPNTIGGISWSEPIQRAIAWSRAVEKSIQDMVQSGIR